MISPRRSSIPELDGVRETGYQFPILRAPLRVREADRLPDPGQYQVQRAGPAHRLRAARRLSVLHVYRTGCPRDRQLLSTQRRPERGAVAELRVGIRTRLTALRSSISGCPRRSLLKCLSQQFAKSSIAIAAWKAPPGSNAHERGAASRTGRGEVPGNPVRPADLT